MNLTQQESLVQYLNTYCFSELWNSVYEESRVNVSLTPLSPRLQTSTVVFRKASISLPDRILLYMTYACPYTLINNAVSLPVGQWVRSDLIVGEQQAWLSVYDVTGHVTPMASVWFLRVSQASDVIVAVEKNAFLNCLVGGFDTPVYLTAFRGSNASKPMSAWSWRIQGAGAALKTQLQNVAGVLNQAVAQSAAGTIFWVNGCEYPSGGGPALVSGDYIDILLDLNVNTIYSVTVDLVPGDYESTLYNGTRTVLHCPKALNVNNEIRTHNSATLFVRNAATEQGVMLHRTSPVSVKQITHNDISVDRSVLDALITGLACQTVTVVVRQRSLAHPLVVMDDAFYMKDLYLCDDATIVALLSGRGDQSVGFWQASQLEQSSYIGLLFNDVYQLDASRLGLFIQALGYDTVGAILCRNLTSTPYAGEVLFIEKPYVYQGLPVTTVVYDEGRKVSSSTVIAVPTTGRRQQVDLSGAGVSKGDMVTVCLLEGGVLSPLRVTPTQASPTVVIQTGVIGVYEETVLGSAMVGYERTTLVAYTPIVAGTNTYAVYDNGDGTSTVVFYPVVYGTTMIIQTLDFMVMLTQTIDTVLEGLEPVVIPVQVVANDGTHIPVLGYGLCDVFINGYKLVDGIDYVLSPLESGNGVALLDVVICNECFLSLNTPNNVVDVYIYSGTLASRDIGYVVNNVLPRPSRVSLWYPTLGQTHVEGALVRNLVDDAVYLLSSDPISNGSVYEISTTYPRILEDALVGYTPIADQQRLALVDAYLKRILPAYPSVIPVTKEHTLYSPYLMAITGDIISHKLIAVNDPDDAAFLRQFSAYQYLRDRDLCLSGNNAVDRRFVSVSAAYTQLPETSAANTIIIQRLITLTLVTAPQTLGSVLV